jgi:uncharacterized protein YbjT (DUF2867 family)
MILITGATGSNGTELVKLLASRGIPVRAMVRSKNGATKIAGLPGVELAIGDFDNPATLDQALQGVERAFLLTNSTERAESSSARSSTPAAVLDCGMWSSCPSSPPTSAPRCASCAITPRSSA